MIASLPGEPEPTTAGAWDAPLASRLAEGLGAAKTYATRDHYDIDVNKELIGLGAANVSSGLVSGMM